MAKARRGRKPTVEAGGKPSRTDNFFDRPIGRLQQHIDPADLIGGLSVPLAKYIVSSARVITKDDAFASALLRNLAEWVAFIKFSAEDDFHLVQWPDGLVAIVRTGLAKPEYEQELVRAYELAFVRLVHSLETEHLYGRPKNRSSE